MVIVMHLNHGKAFLVKLPINIIYLHGSDEQTFNSFSLTLTVRIVHEIEPSILSFQNSNCSVFMHAPGWVKAMEGPCSWFH